MKTKKSLAILVIIALLLILNSRKESQNHEEISEIYKKVAQHGYFTPGGPIFENGQYKLSAKEYYFSSNNINVILELEGGIDDEIYDIENLSFYNSKIEEIKGMTIGYGSFRIKGDKGTVSLELEHLEGDALESPVELHFDLVKESMAETENSSAEDTVIAENLKFKLTQKSDHENVEIPINESFKADEMEFEIKKLSITPTTMNLSLNAGSETLVFYDFDKIFFKSEKGEFHRISNGTTRTQGSSENYVYYFETPYFESSEKLTLIIDGMYALSKSKSSVTVDLDKKTMVEAIDDRLTLTDVDEKENSYMLHFESPIDDTVNFASYDGISFSQTEFHNSIDKNGYIVKIEKDKLEDQIVEIDFSHYPNLVEFKKEINIISNIEEP